MSVNNQRQALTRERVLPPGANQSLEVGHHYPYDRRRSFTIATIIQHSAENLHENSHHESHIASGRNALSHGTPQVSFLFCEKFSSPFFCQVLNLANQFRSTRPPALRHDIFRRSQADLSIFLQSHKKNRKCAKKLACCSGADLLVISTTVSPQLHHVLPPNSPRSAHRKSKNPLQKRHSTMQKKITKYTAKDPDLSRWRRLAGGHTPDRPRSPSPCL
jgi:hypothetical protein